MQHGVDSAAGEILGVGPEMCVGVEGFGRRGVAESVLNGLDGFAVPDE